MNKNSYGILHYLHFKYLFTEDFFKEKIGSGDYLKKLLDVKVLRKMSLNLYTFNEDIGFETAADEDHLGFINYYEERAISKYTGYDYDTLFNKYHFNLNIAYHYFEIGRYDEGIKYIIYIAKKVIYWGFEKELYDLCEAINLSSRDDYLSYYIKLLISLLTNRSYDIQIPIEMNKNNITDFLYNNIQNLFGIHYANNDKRDKAIIIYDQMIDELKDSDLLSLGIAYENQFILKNFDTDCVQSIELIDNAIDCFNKCEDIYELLKAKLYKMKIKYKFGDYEENELIDIRKSLDVNFFPDLDYEYYKFKSQLNPDGILNINEYFELKVKTMTLCLLLEKDYSEEFIEILIRLLKYVNDTRDKGKLKEVDFSILESFFAKYKINPEKTLLVIVKKKINGENYSSELELIDTDTKKFIDEYLKDLETTLSKKR